MKTNKVGHKSWFKIGLPYILLMIAPLCWAGNIVLARGVAEIIPPVSLAFWRWAIAFIILLPLVGKSMRQDWSLVIVHWKIMIFLSLTGISLFNVLLYTAVHNTTAINGALIQTVMPAAIIVISVMLFGDKINRIQVTGVSLCAIGAVYVVLHGKFSNFLNLSFKRGDMLMIIAVIFYALYSACLRKRPKIHPMSFLGYTFGLGALFLLPFYLWEIVYVDAGEMNKNFVFSILYVAIFPSIVGYFCWNSGIGMIGANRGGLFINLIPVFASLMAIIWLAEKLMVFHVVGMGLIFVGMILFNRYSTGR
jgi:drug/metabolite transporter (DMT)-like permease